MRMHHGRLAAAAAALTLAATLGTGAPAWAQTATTTPTGHLSVWVSDGFGGGTVTGPGGIHCYQGPWADPYGDVPQPDPTGTCDAAFPVGTSVTLTARADPGSYINYWDPPSSLCNYHSYSCTVTLKVVQGYNAADFMFCPEDGLCSAMY
ncbi:hypothetical protein ABT095_17865 [Kitasatospora sp. NPDC002227]|uniref:hypothetical protein n=1 Tax=Kitasatospora sp. NPDC002227 TaxID=3154773 RepID=UPI0033217D95